MHSKYSIVAARANRICEYCNAPEIISNVAFEVDHTTPLSKGGTDNLENLALCCRICNLRKSDHTTAIYPLTQASAPSSIRVNTVGQIISRNPPHPPISSSAKTRSVVHPLYGLISTQVYRSVLESSGLR